MLFVIPPFQYSKAMQPTHEKMGIYQRKVLLMKRSAINTYVIIADKPLLWTWIAIVEQLFCEVYLLAHEEERRSAQAVAFRERCDMKSLPHPVFLLFKSVFFVSAFIYLIQSKFIVCLFFCLFLFLSVNVTILRLRSLTRFS